MIALTILLPFNRLYACDVGISLCILRQDGLSLLAVYANSEPKRKGTHINLKPAKMSRL